MNDVGDSLAVWLGEYEDSTAFYLIVAFIAFMLAAAAFVLAIYLAKQKAAVELAHYGGRHGPLNSFVCKVCLHRSYAASHINRRYCARCDKTYPEKAKIWRLEDARAERFPPGGNEANGSTLERSSPLGRRATSP